MAFCGVLVAVCGRRVTVCGYWCRRIPHVSQYVSPFNWYGLMLQDVLPQGVSVCVPVK